MSIPLIQIHDVVLGHRSNVALHNFNAKYETKKCVTLRLSHIGHCYDYTNQFDVTEYNKLVLIH